MGNYFFSSAPKSPTFTKSELRVYAVNGEKLDTIISTLQQNNIKTFKHSELGFGTQDCYYIAIKWQPNLKLDPQKWNETAAPYEYFIKKGYVFSDSEMDT